MSEVELNAKEETFVGLLEDKIVVLNELSKAVDSDKDYCQRVIDILQDALISVRFRGLDENMDAYARMVSASKHAADQRGGELIQIALKWIND